MLGVHALLGGGIRSTKCAVQSSAVWIRLVRLSVLLCAWFGMLVLPPAPVHASLTATLPQPKDAPLDPLADRPDPDDLCTLIASGNSAACLELEPDGREGLYRALREQEINGRTTTGMLVINAISGLSVSATLFFPDDYSTRYQYVGHYPRDLDNLSTAMRVAWTVVTRGGVTESGFRFEAETLDEHSSARRGTVGRDPLLTLRVPLSGRAVLRVFGEMAEIEDEKPQFDVFAPGSESESISSENSVSYLRRFLAAAYRSCSDRGQACPDLPDPADFLTPLDWMFELFLTARPTFTEDFVRGASATMAGCRNPAFAGDRRLEMRRLTKAVLDQPESELRQSAADVLIDIVRFSLDPARNMVQAALSALSEEELDGQPPVVLEALGRELNRHPHLAELVATGVYDPVFLNVIDCIVRREVFANENYALDNVVYRSQYYRLASNMIRNHFEGEGFDVPPLFFDAAHHVTRMMGVGAIDANERWSHLVGDIPENVRNRLRNINEALFKRNREVIRRLLAHRGDVLFDPLQQSTVPTPRDFDLRMVLFEQSIVQEILDEEENSTREQIDRTLSRLTTPLFKMRLPGSGDGHDANYLNRTVGQLVDTLDENNADRNRFKGVDGGDIFADRFSNYWRRVAIGSAYVFIMHAAQETGRADNGAQSDAEIEAFVAPLIGPYQRYLKRILDSAPRADRQSAEADLYAALVSIGGGADDEDLRKALTNSLALIGLRRDGGSPSKRHYGCRMDHTPPVFSEEVRRMPPWSVLGALATDDASHAESLASVYESAVSGGALQGAPEIGDGDYKEAVCNAIQRRLVQTKCLLLDNYCGDDQPSNGVLRFEGNEIVLLGYVGNAAQAFRGRLPYEVWPHLAHAIDNLSVAVLPTAEELTNRTLDERKWWATARHYLDEISAAPEAAEALGFTPGEYDSFAALAAAVGGPEQSSEIANIEWVEKRVNPVAALGRLRNSKIRESLQRIVDRVEQLPEEIRPRPYVVRPASAQAGSTGAGAGPRRRRGPMDSSRRGGFEGFGGGADVVFELTPYGTDGLSTSTAYWRTERPLVGGATVHHDRLRSVFNIEAAGRSPDEPTQLLGSAVDRPLGLKLLDVAVDADGSMRIVTPGNQSNQITDVRQARAVLVALGLPELVSEADIQYRIDSDFDELEMLVTPKIGGLELDQFKLVWMEDGISRNDVRNQLFDGLNASVRGARCDDLKGVLEPLYFNSEIGGVPVRLGLRGDDAACEGGSPSVFAELVRADGDAVEGLMPWRMQITAKMDLMVGDQHASARATVDVDRNGFEPRGVELDGETDAVAQRLHDAVVSSRVIPGLATSDLRTRLLAGSSLRLDLTGTVSIARDEAMCAVPFAVQVPLAGDGNVAVEELIRSTAADLGTELVGSCATSITANTFRGWIDGVQRDGISLMGVNWRVVDIRRERDLVRVLTVSVTDGDVVHTVENLEVRFADGRVRFSTARLSPSDRAALSSVLLARLRSVGGPLLDNVQMTDPTVSVLANGVLHGYTDVVIREVPYFGDLSLGRLDFTDITSEDLRRTLRSAFVEQARGVLRNQIGVGRTITLPHMGALDVEEVDFELLDDGPALTIVGDLEVSMGVKLKVALTLPGVDVEVRDGMSAALGILENHIGEIVNFGGDLFELDQPRFVELGPGRYGLLVDAEVDFRFVSFDIDRIVLSVDGGLQIPGSISVRVPVPIEMGAVALTNIGLTYDTGQTYNTGRRRDRRGGLMLHADVVPITSLAAVLVKVDATLDLRDLDSLRFAINGDVVVLGAMKLWLVSGETDLARGKAEFNVESAPALSKVLEVEQRGWIDGKELGVAAAMDVLGVELNAELRALVDCEDLGRRNGCLSLTSRIDTPIGVAANAGFSSDLDIGHPTLDANVALDLFGWRAGEAGVSANSSEARATIEFLKTQFAVVAPSVDRFDPAAILAMLKNLFDIDLKDLKRLIENLTNLNIGKIEINLGGKISDGSSNGPGSSRGDPPRGGSRPPGPDGPAGPPGGPAPPNRPAGPPGGPAGPPGGSPPPPGGSPPPPGGSPPPPGGSPPPPGGSPPPPGGSPPSQPAPLPGPGEGPEVDSQERASIERAGQEWNRMVFRNTAVRRGQPSCDNKSNAPLVEVEWSPDASTAQMPLFCWTDAAGKVSEVRGQLFVRHPSRDIAVQVTCPPEVAEDVRDDRTFKQICGSRSEHWIALDRQPTLNDREVFDTMDDMDAHDAFLLPAVARTGLLSQVQADQRLSNVRQLTVPRLEFDPRGTEEIGAEESQAFGVGFNASGDLNDIQWTWLTDSNRVVARSVDVRTLHALDDIAVARIKAMLSVDVPRLEPEGNVELVYAGTQRRYMKEFMTYFVKTPMEETVADEMVVEEHVRLHVTDLDALKTCDPSFKLTKRSKMWWLLGDEEWHASKSTRERGDFIDRFRRIACTLSEEERTLDGLTSALQGAGGWRSEQCDEFAMESECEGFGKEEEKIKIEIDFRKNARYYILGLCENMNMVNENKCDVTLTLKDEQNNNIEALDNTEGNGALMTVLNEGPKPAYLELTLLSCEGMECGWNISVYTVEPSEQVAWDGRELLCGKKEEFEQIIESAHNRRTGEEISVDLYQWAHAPAEYAREYGLAHDPVDALLKSPSDLACMDAHPVGDGAEGGTVDVR